MKINKFSLFVFLLKTIGIRGIAKVMWILFLNSVHG